jgi:uncharacterized protein (DUF1330 family)
MEQLDLLRYVARIIEDMGLRYFVTGSTATIFYGEPRFTNDIDVVVEISEQRVVDFCRRFPQDEFYVSEAAARQAVLNKRQFNIIHPASGLKVDVIVPEPSPFNESRFVRVRRLHAADDFDACFASPEDAIIKKMDYYRQGGSEKHLRDIAGVLKTSRDQIDLAYIARWARQMGLGDLWSAIQERMKGKA